VSNRISYLFRNILDSIRLIGVSQCQESHLLIWATLQSIYFGGLLVWGAYLAYQTRDAWHKYNYQNESQSILLSIYNLGFCGTVLVPLITSLQVDNDTLFFLVALAIIFPTTFALFTVYGPKVVSFLSSSLGKKSTASKGSAKDTGVDKASVLSIKTLEIPPKDKEYVIEELKEERQKEHHQRKTTTTRRGGGCQTPDINLLEPASPIEQTRSLGVSLVGIEKIEGPRPDSPTGDEETPPERQVEDPLRRLNQSM